MSLKSCCSSQHPFETFNVRENWWPAAPVCLIIGESPGGSDAHYFYDEHHWVRIRRNLFMGLYHFKLIPEPTLAGFRDSGFLFDHSIRCQLSSSEIKQEWAQAKKYKSPRAAAAHHLLPLLDTFPMVWVMGYLARNAVAVLDTHFPRTNRGLSVPYVPDITTRYFVSRYLLNIGDREVLSIVETFKQFITCQRATSLSVTKL